MSMSGDNVIVSLTFDNADFMRGVEATLGKLNELKGALNFTNTGGIFGDLQGAADNVNLEGIGSAVDSISDRFSALGAAAFTVIQNITTSVIDAGKQMADAIIDPIIAGGSKRAHAIENAKFQFEGLGLDVEAAMQSALDAVQGTAYGLDEAATLAGVFGSAGLKAGEELTGGLRAVAGIAAQTTSGFSEIGAVFQNIAALGHVTTNDLNSLALRGLGFNTIAEKMGITVEELRQRATDSSITFREFASAMDLAFGEHAQDANETYEGSLKNLHSALGRLGEDFLTPKFEGTRKIFNALSPTIDKVADALIPLVAVWTKLVNISSRRVVTFLEDLDFNALNVTMKKIAPEIQNILRNISTAVRKFIIPIKEAFTDIFPRSSSREINNIAHAIQEFTNKLVISDQTADLLKRTFRGIFSVARILIAVIAGIVGVFFDLGGSVGESAGGFLEFTAGLGDTLTRLKEFLVDGGRISGFFDAIGRGLDRLIDIVRESSVVQFLTTAIHELGEALSGLFFGTDEADGGIARLQNRFAGAEGIFTRVGQGIITGVEAIQEAVSAVFDYLSEAFSGLGEAIGNSLNEGEFSEILDVLNLALLGGLAAALNRFFDGGINFSMDTFGLVNANLARLNTTLAAMAIEIKAGALLKIGQALLLLAIAVGILSLIDSAALTRSMVAITAGLGQLAGVMVLLSSPVMGPTGAVRLLALSIAIGTLSVALLFMSFAIRSLASLGWEDMVKGLLGTLAMLGIMVVASRTLTTGAPGMIAAGLGLIAVSIGLNIMARAVKKMSELGWEEMARGLVGVGVALLSMALALRMMPSNMFSIGLGLLAASVGLIAVSYAVKRMSDMNWSELLRGLAGLAGALLLMALASRSMQSAILGAVSVGIMAISLMLLAKAIEIMSDLGWADLGFGLLAVAAALTVLGLAAHILAETGAVVAMAALGVALIPLAYGLKVFAEAISAFSNIGFGDLMYALLGITLGLTVLGLAAYALADTGALAALAGLGLALILIGGAFALFGAGVWLVAEGLSSLIALGPQALDALEDIALTVIGLIPTLASELAEGVIGFMQIIFDAAPELVEGFVIMIGDLLEGLTTLAPQFGEAMVAMIIAGLNTIHDVTPQIVETGIFVLMSLLRGIRENMGRINHLGMQLIIRFMNAVGQNIQRIVNLGTRIIIAILTGIRENLGRIIPVAGSIVTRFINGMRQQIERIVTAGTNMVVAVMRGIGRSANRIVNVGVNLIIRFMNGIRQASHRLTEAAFQLVIGLINDLTNSINSHAGELREAGGRLAIAIIDGMTGGLASGAHRVFDSVRNIASNALDSALGALGIGSPSKEFIKVGQAIIDGWAMGMQDSAAITATTEQIGADVISTAKLVTTKVAEVMQDMDSIEPTITPVLDLSQVERQASGVSDILGGGAISAEASTGHARTISLDTGITPDVAGAPTGSGDIVFNQTVNAPTTLSVGDIYRQTKTQISIAKEELRRVS